MKLVKGALFLLVFPFHFIFATMHSALTHLGVQPEQISKVLIPPAPPTTTTSEPPLLGRLAVAYYCATFGLFTWIWVTIVLLCRAFPLLYIPAIA
jgi:hypothetical protein